MKQMNSFFLPKEVGQFFHYWHEGMDAVYRVGSLAVAEKPIPREEAEKAIAILRNCKKDEIISRSRDREELSMLIELLTKNIVLLDLVEELVGG